MIFVKIEQMTMEMQLKKEIEKLYWEIGDWSNRFYRWIWDLKLCLKFEIEFKIWNWIWDLKLNLRFENDLRFENAFEKWRWIWGVNWKNGF